MKLPLNPIGLSRIDAARYCGIGVTLFDLQVAEGVLPKPIKMGGRLVYDRRRIDAFFDSFNQTVQPLEVNPWDIQ